jgi:ubiquinone/menaquinone biosynthesis C-methylase UbiE
LSQDIAQQNQQVYSRPGIVGYYAQLSSLQAAEAQLIANLGAQLSQMAMLDLGVGAGRTTRHFAPRVADYTGIDYSAAMIAACIQTFAGWVTHAGQPLTWRVGDARALEIFPDQAFDLILFSFNGLDFMTHPERLQVLTDLYRLCRPGGYVCFSSHNLQGIESQFSWRRQWRWNPLTTYVNLCMSGVWRWCNPGLSLVQLQAAPHWVVRDESHNFRLKTYYVRPLEQVRQLLAAGFRQIQVLTWHDGTVLAQVPGPQAPAADDPQFASLLANRDQWLDYLCRR